MHCDDIRSGGCYTTNEFVYMFYPVVFHYCSQGNPDFPSVEHLGVSPWSGITHDPEHNTPKWYRAGPITMEGIVVPEPSTSRQMKGTYTAHRVVSKRHRSASTS